MGSPTKGASNEIGSDSPRGVPPHSLAAGGGQAALANFGNFVSWVKQSTLAVFQTPKRELSPEEVDLREVGVDSVGSGSMKDGNSRRF